MSNHSRRALRATMAAAGAATLGLSFVGTAAASDAPNVDDQNGAPSYGGESPDSMLSQDSAPSIDNELLTFEMPRVENSSYDTPLDGYTMGHDSYGDDEDGNNDDEDNVCHGTGGSQNVGDFGVFQHPCQSHDNTFGEGDVQILGHTFSKGHDSGSDDDSWGDDENSDGPSFRYTAFETPDSGSADSDSFDSFDADTPSDGSDYNSLVNHDANQGDVEQSDPVMSMMGSSSPSPLAGVSRMNGYSFGMNNG